MKKTQGTFGIIMFVLLSITILLIIGPLIVIAVSAFDPITQRFPIEGFTLKWFVELAKKERFMKAALISLIFSIIASAVATALALLSAVGLRYCSGRVKNTVNMIMLSPMFVPSIVLGLALYQVSYLLFGSRQSWMLLLGLTISVITIPMRTILASFENISTTVDEAAMIVGCNPFRMIWAILLPQIKPAFFSGWMLAFVHVWNDFNISIWLASPKFYPLSIEIYSFTKEQSSPLLSAMSVCLILFSAAIVLLINKFFGLSGVANIRST